MHPDAYKEMAATEERHWWFAGRRTILRTFLRSLSLPPTARILEIGAGTGGNLEMLSEFGQVCALEMCPEARDCALQKTCGLPDIRLGLFPNDNPFTDERFDLVCLFDVLEHMEDDAAALRAMRQQLVPGGLLLLTVPAYAWLWSSHDVFLHHRRRYSRRELVAKAAGAGLEHVRSSHMNTLLFPLIAGARLWDNLRGNMAASGTAIPPPALNASLRTVFSLERLLVPHMALPFGSTVLALFRATGA